MSGANLHRREGLLLTLGLAGELLWAESNAAWLFLHHGICWLLLYTLELLRVPPSFLLTATSALFLFLLFDVAQAHEWSFYPDSRSTFRTGSLVLVHWGTLAVGSNILRGRTSIWQRRAVPSVTAFSAAMVVFMLTEDTTVFFPAYALYAAASVEYLWRHTDTFSVVISALLPSVWALLGFSPQFFRGDSWYRNGVKVSACVGFFCAMVLRSRRGFRAKWKWADTMVSAGLVCAFIHGFLAEEGLVENEWMACLAGVVITCVTVRNAWRTLAWTAALGLAWEAVGGEWTIFGVNMVLFGSVAVNAMGDEAFPSLLRPAASLLLVLYLRWLDMGRIAGDSQSDWEVFLALLGVSFNMSILASMWTGRQLNIWSKLLHAYLLVVLFSLDAWFGGVQTGCNKLQIGLLVVEIMLCEMEGTTIFLTTVGTRIIVAELDIGLEDEREKKILFLFLLLGGSIATVYARVNASATVPPSVWLIQSGAIGLVVSAGFCFAWFELNALYVALLTPFVVCAAFALGLGDLPKQLSLRTKAIFLTNAIVVVSLVFIAVLAAQAASEAQGQEIGRLCNALVLLLGLFNCGNAAWLGWATRNPSALQKKCASACATLAFLQLYITYLLFYAADTLVLLLISPLLYFAGYLLESETARPFGVYLAGTTSSILVQALYILLIQGFPFRGEHIEHNSLYVESHIGKPVSIWSAEGIQTPLINMALLAVAASPMYGLVRFFVSSKFNSRDIGKTLLPIQVLPLLFADLYETKLLSLLALTFATVRYIAAKRMFAKLKKLI